MGVSMKLMRPVPGPISCTLRAGRGHIPCEGLKAGATKPIELPGILLAALATLSMGLVLGPEAPLIALGTLLAILAVRLAKKDTPSQLIEWRSNPHIPSADASFLARRPPRTSCRSSKDKHHWRSATGRRFSRNPHSPHHPMAVATPMVDQ